VFEKKEYRLFARTLTLWLSNRSTRRCQSIQQLNSASCLNKNQSSRSFGLILTKTLKRVLFNIQNRKHTPILFVKKKDNSLASMSTVGSKQYYHLQPLPITSHPRAVGSTISLPTTTLCMHLWVLLLCEAVRRNKTLAPSSMVEASRCGWIWEKIISEGGGFRSEVVGSGGQRNERGRER
jgi:hypothetical protein